MAAGGLIMLIEGSESYTLAWIEILVNAFIQN